VSASSKDSVLLRIEHLESAVKQKVLVDDADFQVHSGEVLAIAGPSGAGKTSLLRLLNRLDEPTTGTVFLKGADYRQIPPRELPRRLGMVTQRPFLFQGTVADNLRFGPAQRGEPLPAAAIDDLLARVGLDAYGTRDVANLSGGEARRVSVARTLANSPLALLLDEPTPAPDESAKREVESLLQEIIREQRTTCIVVTHDVAQAVRLADRALLLKLVGIVRAGPVNEVLHA
jgi:putative ABC transport system ATP-binding protein